MNKEGASVEEEGALRPAETTISGVSLDRLVNRLFEASLAVTACRTLVDTRVAHRLRSVTDMLDFMIRDVRQAVFDTYGAQSSIQARPAIADPLPLEPAETATGQHDPVVPILKQVSLTVETLWRVVRDDDQRDAAVALGEAIQSLHRALIALDGAARPPR